MIVEKKVWPQYFQKILDGKKKWELRLADFECKEGDVLLLREWCPQKKEYTGRVIEKDVSSVVKTKDVQFWSKEDVDEHGFQVIGFR